MNLTTNFTLEELTKSDTAIRLGIDNTPDDEAFKNLAILCAMVLEPIRKYYGKALQVHSAFRNLELNKAVGSKPTSDHVIGCAADIEIAGVGNPDLAMWCAKNLVFNQIILEFYNQKDGPNSGWVHVAYHPVGANKMERLIINKDGTSYF